MAVKPPVQGPAQPTVGEAFYSLWSAVGSSFSNFHPAQAAPQQAAANGPNNAEIVFNSEIQKFGAKIVNQISFIPAEYPLITATWMVASPFFALNALFSFNPISILLGITVGAFTYALGKNIYNEGIGSFLAKVPGSLFSIGSFVNVRAATQAPAPSVVPVVVQAAPPAAAASA